MFDFSKTKAATANNYLNPGIYRLRPTEVKLDKFAKGSEYIGIKFETEDGQSFIEKFNFGTEKGNKVSAERLQYLHEGFFGKSLTKNFTSTKEIADYFSKYLTTKPIVKTIVVGGRDDGKNVYACLPYAGFFVDEDSDVELGEFESGSAQYKKVVRKDEKTSEVAGRANGLLNDTDGDAPIGGGKATAKTTAKAKAEVAAEDEDEPW